MMLRFAFLAAGGLALSAMAAGQTAGTDAPDAPALLQSCEAHKFETTVHATVNGKPRTQKVKICGVAGQSDSDWKRTLQDAIAKVEANPSMAAEVKQQIIGALALEVSKIGSSSAGLRAAPGQPVTGLLDIKPDAASPLAPVRRVPPPQSRPLEQDYGSLKPLPDVIAASPPALLGTAGSAAATPSLPRLPGPRLRLLCERLGETGTAETCSDVYQNTVFTIRADEPVAPGTSLRFMRKGDDRGDIELAQMRAGQSVRVKLPRHVCSGVVRSSLQIQVLRRPQSSAAPQVVDDYGPFYLRC
jgi:hypothetical protein